MNKLPKKSNAAVRRKSRGAGRQERGGSSAGESKYVLRLYVSGSTAKSTLAVNNIKRVCEQYLKHRYDLEVIDVYQQANLARDKQLVALPTLIKKLPLPLRKLVGDLSLRESVLRGLDLKRSEP